MALQLPDKPRDYDDAGELIRKLEHLWEFLEAQAREAYEREGEPERLARLEARMYDLESAADDPWAGQPVLIGGAPEPRRPAGPQLFPSSAPEVLWAEVVTEVGSGKYTFKEVVRSDATTWKDKTGGRTGDCYEANDVTGIPNETDDGTGAVVKIRIEHDTTGTVRYVFAYESGVPPGDADGEILVWDETTDKAWEASTPIEVTVVTNYQVSGVKLQKKTRTLKVVAAGAESAWTDVHEGTECP